MNETADGLTSYILALVYLFYAAVLANSSAIMTIGGLILLGLRLYVDGKKAWRVFKDRDKE